MPIYYNLIDTPWGRGRRRRPHVLFIAIEYKDMVVACRFLFGLGGPSIPSLSLFFGDSGPATTTLLLLLIFAFLLRLLALLLRIFALLLLLFDFLLDLFAVLVAPREAAAASSKVKHV